MSTSAGAPGAALSGAAAGRVSVVAENVSVAGRVGKSKFDLTKQADEAKQALTSQKLTQIGVDLTANVIINGSNVDDVSFTAETTQKYFEQMIEEVESLSNRPVLRHDINSVRLHMAEKFQAQIEDILENDPRHALMRQDSLAFIDSIHKAEDLLQKGSSAYVESVRKLISTGDRVTIAVRGLSFVDTQATDTTKAGPSTVGSVIADTLLCPFRSFRRRATGSPAGYNRLLGEPEGGKRILDDLNLLFRPGRLTLVLGPPGSSKSSFLKAISGQLFDAPGSAKLTGKVEYNGFDVTKLKNLAAWVSYVQQTDEHQALLTTRETLEFAWKCRREPIFDKHPDDDKYKALKQVEVDIILATLGLTGCKDTFIGNSTLKGVSGGEKRRVTLGEKLVTGSPVLALDEISTGLDAAATYDIVAHLSSVCHILGQTIVVALLQPPPEVIDLFDDVICLAEGHVIYHGERTKVLEYFEGLGFALPERVELGDFLQAIPTKDGQKFFVRTGTTTPQPKSAADFARAWKASSLYKAEEIELDAALGRRGVSLDDAPQLGFFSSLLLVSKITMRLKLRETAQLASKVFSNVVMGSFFGSLFWKLGSDQAYLKAMLLFQIPSFVFGSSFPNVQVLSKQKPVYLKQLDASFYTPAVFTIAQFLVALPFTLFDILCFGNIVYWCTGLSEDPWTFAQFLALVVSYAIAINTAFGVFPFLAAKEDTSIMLAALFLLMCLLNAGLVATPDIIPTSVIWLFWMDPLAWVLRSLSINEYHSGGAYDDNPCKFVILGKTLTVKERCGDYFLKMRQIKTDDDFVWMSHVFMAVFTLFFLILSLYAVGRVRFEEERSERTTKEKGAGDEEEQGLPAMRRPAMVRQESISIPRQQLCVRNLWYTVNVGGEDIDILKDVTFHTIPGRSLALMGGSGAGKTTLLDGRKTVGKWRGEILIDGQPKVQNEFTKYTGYVEQFGVHVASATVLESLQFSAELRLPQTYSSDQKRVFIREQLQILELEELQDSICAGLSMEQNKRLTLGVELVANPSILFADEPTSSLDARAAAFVMRVLNKIAASGRTVICTIHQPSAEVFYSFDDLLLLKRGGQVVFFGELGAKAKTLIDYLEAIPGTPSCPKNSNPGTWMLEVLGAGTAAGSSALDFAAYYQRSAMKKKNDDMLGEILSMDRNGLISSLATPAITKLRALETSTRQPYVRSRFFQFKMLVMRSFRAYWRTASFTLARFVVIGILTLLFSIVFWQHPLKNVADIQSRVVLLYFYANVLAMYNMYSIIPFAMARLPVLYRERATQMYSVLAHVTADSLVEIPYVLAEVLLGGGALYAAVGLNAGVDRMIFYFALIFGIVYLLTMFGLLFASLMPDPLSAQLSAIAVVQILQIFSGVLVPKQDLPKFYEWMYYFSPFKWATEGVIATQFKSDETQICAPFGEIPRRLSRLGLCTSDGSDNLAKVSGILTTAEEFVFSEFLPDFKYENRWTDLVILASWIVAIRLLTIFTVTFVNHNRR